MNAASLPWFNTAQSLLTVFNFVAQSGNRHYVGPEANPKGVLLARENLRMMQDLMPRAARLLGLGVVPRI